MAREILDELRVKLQTIGPVSEERLSSGWKCILASFNVETAERIVPVEVKVSYEDPTRARLVVTSTLNLPMSDEDDLGCWNDSGPLMCVIRKDASTVHAISRVPLFGGDTYTSGLHRLIEFILELQPRMLSAPLSWGGHEMDQLRARYIVDAPTDERIRAVMSSFEGVAKLYGCYIRRRRDRSGPAF